MRAFVLACFLFLVLVAVGSASQAYPTESRSDSKTPGPYTGPDSSLFPPGWRPFAQDVHKQCGKYALLFQNPDLREDQDDWIHAQGQFFIQFQVVGEGSGEVTKMSFSFGKTDDALYDNPTVNCNEDIPESPAGQGTGGAYLLYYRSDFEKADGFFVPILTNNVPDGEYAAAIHAYNAAGTEVARAWAKAKVDNCNPTTQGERCAVDSPESVAHDHTKPWPMVLPGDGEQTNGVNGLTVEFAEPVNDTVEVKVNGEVVPLADWTPPARDDDVVPNNDDQDCPVNVPQVCTRKVYGPGFKWENPVAVGDIIEVYAVDANGNEIFKQIHYGLDTSGGTVDLQRPELKLSALNGQTVAIQPGDFHEFVVRVENIGADVAHTQLAVAPTDPNATLTTYWMNAEGGQTSHLVVEAGQQVEAKVHVQSDAATPHETFEVLATATYDVEGQDVTKELRLMVTIDPNASGTHHGTHGGNATSSPTPTNETARTEGGEGGGGIPGPGAPLFVACLGALGAALSRRRW